MRVKRFWWTHPSLRSYIYLAPLLVLFVAFYIYPFVSAIDISFRDYQLLSDEPSPFVGLAKYERLITDPLIGKTLWNTIRYVAYFAIPDVVIALALALLLNQRVRGLSFFRAAFFAPVVTSTVATCIVWTYLYQPNFGLLTHIVRLFGVPKQTILVDPKTALIGVAAYSVWKVVGYNMIVFLAGLQGIPSTFYEAARIDGASGWDSFRHITLPLLQPTTLFVAVLTTIGSFQAFTQIFIMTYGGPLKSTLLIVQYVYEIAFQGRGHDAGYASAVSLMLFVIIISLTLVQLRIGRSRWEY